MELLDFYIQRINGKIVDINLTVEESIKKWRILFGDENIIKIKKLGLKYNIK